MHVSDIEKGMPVFRVTYSGVCLAIVLSEVEVRTTGISPFKKATMPCVKIRCACDGKEFYVEVGDLLEANSHFSRQKNFPLCPVCLDSMEGVEWKIEAQFKYPCDQIDSQFVKLGDKHEV